MLRCAHFRRYRGRSGAFLEADGCPYLVEMTRLPDGDTGPCPSIAVGYGAHRRWNLVPHGHGCSNGGGRAERTMSETRIEPAHKPQVVIPQVVIVGGGFGGLSAAKALAKAPFEIKLIDRNNHHLFQPLLYQVATAAL